MQGTIEYNCEGLLGGAMRDHGVLVETIITPEMMPGKYALVFRTMKHLFSIGANPDFITLFIEPSLVECRGILESIDSSGFVSANWQYYQKNILELWGKNRIVVLGKELAMGDGSSDQLIERAESVILEVGNASNGNLITGIGDMVGGFNERLAKRMENKGKIPGISWGLEKIDTCTLGAQAGQLVVIGGRPSEGKSAIAVQLLAYQGIVCKESVGMITIESSANDVITRMISSGAKINGMDINMGILDIPKLQSIRAFEEKLLSKELSIWIIDRPGISLSEVRSVARRMVISHAIKVLYVDYLQLIHVPDKQGRTEEVQAVSLGLKEIARELNICVVALAQLKRDEKNARPNMASVQHSSQIEQDADQLWLLYHKKDDNGVITESKIILEKVRDGQTSDILVEFDKKVVTFREIDRPFHPTVNGSVKL